MRSPFVSRWLVAWTSCLSLTILLGCTEGPGFKTYPATGVVRYQGKPLANADVVFASSGGNGTSETILGLATTDAEGKFSIRTQWGPTETFDGAVAGDHQVTIAKYIPPNNMTEQEYQNRMAAEVAAMEARGFVTPEETTPPRIPFLPPKFQDPNQSQLRAKVEAGGKNEFVFDLQ